MIKALYTAATGMKTQQVNVDVIANNLANVNTSGFKRSQADFQDLLYIILQAPGAETAEGRQSPTGIEIGSGARLVSTTKVFTQGVLEPTGRKLDVAIQGEGFYEVELPDGSIAYTRDGAFRRDANGELVTPEGYPLKNNITIPRDVASENINFGVDGTVSYTDLQGTQATAGTIELVRFPNPSGLKSLGGNLFAETVASGQAVRGKPGEDGLGGLLPANLERSNVEVVNEMVNLIVAQRAYEVNSRAIRTGDQMLSISTSLTR
ncbi:MAG: flagellar basal-body rod protein FlgG [Planctomycetota bacterium]